MNIPVNRFSVDNSEIGQISDVLDAKGESKVALLEKEFKEYIGCDYSIATNSGTAAMHLAMCAIDLKRGDKIVCSVNSFPSIAEVIRHFDAEPIFVDIDKDTFNISIEEIKKVLENNKHKKLKAIFITHVAGQAADLDEIYALAKENDIKIIEDASYAMGLEYKGKKIGNIEADITTFSFAPSTNQPIANGGIMVTNNEEYYERALLLRNHAIKGDGWDEYGNLIYTYDVVDIGCKYDLSELSGAYLLAQFRKLDKNIQKRVEIAKVYNKELANVNHVSLPVVKNEHIFSLYMIKIDKNRDSFARDLKAKGINTGLYFVPLHLLQYYKNKYSLRVNDFPNALVNFQQILAIPIYPSLKQNEVEYICKQIKDIAKNRV